MKTKVYLDNHGLTMIVVSRENARRLKSIDFTMSYNDILTNLLNELEIKSE